MNNHKYSEARFWSRVDVGGERECWPWKAGKFSSGYGAFRFHGRNRRAHCVAWEIETGPLLPGELVLHKCDNRPCVNPSHLFTGTQRDNCQDAIRKGRFSEGERHGMSKLTAAEVVSIRALAIGKRRCFSRLGRQFGVNRTTVARIVKGKRWKRATAASPSPRP